MSLIFRLLVITVAGSGCLRGKDEKLKRAPAACGGATKSRDAFMVKQIQTLVKIKIMALHRIFSTGRAQ